MDGTSQESTQQGRPAPVAPRPLALVTGGARRLGRRLAVALAQDGYDVAVSYFRSDLSAGEALNELRSLGARAEAFQADLSRADQARRLAEEVEARLGPVALLVNNAGVWPGRESGGDPAEVFDHTVAVNLRAPYLLSLECGRRMRERGEGAIVNVASLGGLRPYARHVPYSLSKAGLIMLTRAMALRLAPEVAVNAIAPGTIWIEGEEDPAVVKPPPEEIPLQHYGDSQDVEGALLYLVGAPYVTGQVIVVDGGAGIRFGHP